jgi:hypothetical protein
MLDLEIVRTGSSELICQPLPDGSAAVFEVATKNVYSLNPSAAAAWDACASATTLSRVAAAMSARLGQPVTEDLAHEAVSELVSAGLVSVSPAERLGTSRREMLKQVAGVALPVVLVLTGAQQRAHAQDAGSEPLTTTPFTPGTTTIVPTTTGGPTFPFCFLKSKDVGETRTPLAGAVFAVHLGGANGPVVQGFEALTTDASGEITGELPAGSYTLVEVSAPPAPEGPYQPFIPQPFTIPFPSQITCFDIRNVVLTTSLGTTAGT